MCNPSRRLRIDGPLGQIAASYEDRLVALGYSERSVSEHRRFLADASRWLEAQGLEARDVTLETFAPLLEERKAAGWEVFVSRRGVKPLLAHLCDLGVIEVPVHVENPLLAHYRHHLVSERGLMASTVNGYVHSAAAFLDWWATKSGASLDALGANDVVEYMLAEARRRSGSARSVVPPLRSFLRFCFIEGVTPVALAQAVPAVANWRLSSLPRAVGPQAVEQLLSTCERSRPAGRRDFAVLKLLTRLGLRAQEIARMELCDLDWRAGELVVHGKGNCLDRLPLPVDVGTAVAEWLGVRPTGGHARAVFTRCQAPLRPIGSRAISAIVRAACTRAGLPVMGTHCLRHSTAVHLLGAGAGLVEISQVLRHRRVLTTAIYAKADLRSLMLVAQPWPGVA